jgi:hypothetical protein
VRAPPAVRSSRGLAVALALAAAGPVAVGCHLAAGIEEAELIEAVVAECTGDGACDDGEPCTIDRCVEGTCVHEALDGEAPTELQTAGDCQRAICLAGELTSAVDDEDLPVDGLVCTSDLCAEGTPQNIPLSGGTPCDQGDGKVCNGNGQCVDCFSNADCTLPETCGGGGTVEVCGCTPIQCDAVGLTCGFYPDDGCGDVLPCNNGALDGDETDVDCGGTVSTCSTRCAAGKACALGSDCASGVCCDTICCGTGQTCNAGPCE